MGSYNSTPYHVEEYKALSRQETANIIDHIKIATKEQLEADSYNAIKEAKNALKLLQERQTALVREHSKVIDCAPEKIYLAQMNEMTNSGYCNDIKFTVPCEVCEVNEFLARTMRSYCRILGYKGASTHVEDNKYVVKMRTIYVY